MSKKKALISGITGQDGSYLADYLLSLGYEVHGIVRRVANLTPEERFSRIRHIQSKIHIHEGCLESFAGLHRILYEVQPDEFYHLAAQSFVTSSFQDEFSTMKVNAEGTHYLLSILRDISPKTRFYFAGTSEMFGKVQESPQNEYTPFYPRSPYGISKVTGYNLTRHYRETYGMFGCTGILFNHESPRRGVEFVTRKITRSAVQIKLNQKQHLSMGNLDAVRDWGFAGDYVIAMHQMLQLDEPDDLVIGTGICHSVEEFIQGAFDELDLNWKNHVVIDPTLLRPSEVQYLKAGPTKARWKIGWNPETSFNELVTMMVKADYEQLTA